MGTKFYRAVSPGMSAPGPEANTPARGKVGPVTGEHRPRARQAVEADLAPAYDPLRKCHALRQPAKWPCLNLDVFGLSPFATAAIEGGHQCGRRLQREW